jgi:hypothetical protein
MASQSLSRATTGAVLTERVGGTIPASSGWRTRRRAGRKAIDVGIEVAWTRAQGVPVTVVRARIIIAHDGSCCAK